MAEIPFPARVVPVETKRHARERADEKRRKSVKRNKSVARVASCERDRKRLKIFLAFDSNPYTIAVPSARGIILIQ